MKSVIVPVGAGVGSAIGFLRAPIAYEITKSAVVDLEDFDFGRVNRLLAEMTRDARAVVDPALRGARSSIRSSPTAAMLARVMRSVYPCRSGN